MCHVRAQKSRKAKASRATFFGPASKNIINDSELSLGNRQSGSNVISCQASRKTFPVYARMCMFSDMFVLSNDVLRKMSE